MTWHKLCDDTVDSVRCGHEGYRQSVRRYCNLYFYPREERLDRATKGADPRTKQTTTRELDWRNLARYDERKVGLDEIVRGARADHVRVSRSLSVERRCRDISGRQNIRYETTVAEVCLVNSAPSLSALSLSALAHTTV